MATGPGEVVDLLEDALVLVLRASDRAVLPRHVGAAGDAQVAHDEVAGVEADPRQGDDVLGRTREQLAERIAGDELLGRRCGVWWSGSCSFSWQTSETLLADLGGVRVIDPRAIGRWPQR